MRCCLRGVNNIWLGKNYFILPLLLLITLNFNIENSKATTISSPKYDIPKNPSEGVLIASIPWKAVTIMVDGVKANIDDQISNWSFNAIPLYEYIYKTASRVHREDISRSGPDYFRVGWDGNIYLFYRGSTFVSDIKSHKVSYIGDLLGKEEGSPVDLELYKNGDVGFLVRDNKSFSDDSAHYIRKNLKGKLIQEKRVLPKTKEEFSGWTLDQGDIYYGKHADVQKIDSVMNLTDNEKYPTGLKVFNFTIEDLRVTRKSIQNEISHLRIAQLHPEFEVNGCGYYWTDGVFEGRDSVEVLYIKNKNGNHKIYVLSPGTKFWHFIDSDGNFYCMVDTPETLEIFKYPVNW